jgi:lipopolysaccharide/colanic/teichoic acid biosynthesis glycosyltransferase
MSKRKRLLGLVFGVIALILVTPLMLLIGLLIKLTSKGPVLFRQQRVGLHQHPFIILKFRTWTTTRTRPIGASLSPNMGTHGSPGLVLCCVA